ncbi:hypothetical protein ACOSQ4_003007 [Xanthoceras sorbifolium]
MDRFLCIKQNSNHSFEHPDIDLHNNLLVWTYVNSLEKVGGFAGCSHYKRSWRSIIVCLLRVHGTQMIKQKRLLFFFWS